MKGRFWVANRQPNWWRGQLLDEHDHHESDEHSQKSSRRYVYDLEWNRERTANTNRPKDEKGAKDFKESESAIDSQR